MAWGAVARLLAGLSLGGTVTRLLSGLSVPEGAGAGPMWLNLLVLGLVLALVNSLIKPVAKFLTFPLYIVTFGLFALVVNGAMLSLTGWLTDHIAALGAGGSVPLGLEVSSFGSAVVGSIIISVISSIIAAMLVRRED
nr:phage holin family protein [uncultured Actinomyces sp.]